MRKYIFALVTFALLGSIAFVLPGTTSSSALDGVAFMKLYHGTENAVLIDIRTPEEYASGHILDALNINFYDENFAQKVSELDVAKTYFIYCRSGSRTHKSLPVFTSGGISRVYELAGGIAGNEQTITLVQDTSVQTVDEYVVDTSDMLANGAFSKAKEAIPSVLTETEIAGLVYMREEEKLAHDIYTVLGEKWGTKIFSNIAMSEQTHTDAVRGLLQAYEISDPVVSNSVGVFTSPQLQNIYTKLLEQGMRSNTDALVVGATVEDLDTFDLDVRMKETVREDILSVYRNLQKGSRNHLRAFTRNLNSLGSTYTPVYISQSSYDAIIAGPQERGRR
ncbi:MAG: DUF2202 domain-containing protein [Minisyncoccia bacterium]